MIFGSLFPSNWQSETNPRLTLLTWIFKCSWIFCLHFSFESFWLTLVNSVYLAVNSTRLSLGNWEKKSCFFKGLLWWLQMNMQIYHPFIQHVLVYMYHWTEASRVYKLGADFKRKFNFWQNYLVIWSNLNDWFMCLGWNHQLFQGGAHKPVTSRVISL